MLIIANSARDNVHFNQCFGMPNKLYAVGVLFCRNKFIVKIVLVNIKYKATMLARILYMRLNPTVRL